MATETYTTEQIHEDILEIARRADLEDWCDDIIPIFEVAAKAYQVGTAEWMVNGISPYSVLRTDDDDLSMVAEEAYISCALSLPDGETDHGFRTPAQALSRIIFNAAETGIGDEICNEILAEHIEAIERSLAKVRAYISANGDTGSTE